MSTTGPADLPRRAALVRWAVYANHPSTPTRLDLRSDFFGPFASQHEAAAYAHRLEVDGGLVGAEVVRLLHPLHDAPWSGS